MTSILHPCERCRSPIEKGDLRCAVCALGVPAENVTVDPSALGQVLRCRGCGASVNYDADARGVRCTFCTLELELEEVLDPLEQVGSWAPFTVDRARAGGALKDWLSRQGFFRPSDLSAKARVDDLTPLYMPAWVFDAQVEVAWAADSDAGSRRSVWAPHSGEVPISFDDVLVGATRGLNPKEVGALLGSYSPTTLQDSASSEQDVGADAIVHEAFDTQRSFARGHLMRGIKQRAAQYVEHNCVPGTRVRKVGVSMRIEGLHTRRVALPVWILAWRYGDQVYRAVISGQDPETIHGKLPISWARIGLIALGLVGLVALVAAVVAMS